MRIKIQMNPEVSKTFTLAGVIEEYPSINVSRSEDGCELIFEPNGEVLKELKRSFLENNTSAENKEEKFGALTTYFYLLDLSMLASSVLRDLPSIYMLSKSMEFFKSETEAINFIRSAVEKRFIKDSNVAERQTT